MKKEELRIGNLIKHKAADSNFVIVKGIHSPLYFETPTGTINSDVFQNFEPILITEAWLETFGFKFNQEKRSYDYKWISVFPGTTTAMIYVHGVRAYGKYVHSLQNLFFAIHGEELSTSVGSK